MHSVLSLIHPLKTLHSAIPLKQMENFLKEVSSYTEPDLTPDPQTLWKQSQEQENKKSEGRSSPLVKDLAESIPKGKDGIDIKEFEANESYNDN